MTAALETVAGVSIPDTALVREATEFIRDAENDLLFDHSRRVYLFGALQGQRRGLRPDLELLYVGAMFHDLGLSDERAIDRPGRARIPLAADGRFRTAYTCQQALATWHKITPGPAHSGVSDGPSLTARGPARCWRSVRRLRIRPNSQRRKPRYGQGTAG